jgi:hypothetical protein
MFKTKTETTKQNQKRYVVYRGLCFTLPSIMYTCIPTATEVSPVLDVVLELGEETVSLDSIFILTPFIFLGNRLLFIPGLSLVLIVTWAVISSKVVVVVGVSGSESVVKELVTEPRNA